MSRLKQEGVSFTTYTNMYTVVYNYCTSVPSLKSESAGGPKGTYYALPLTRATLLICMLLVRANLAGSDLYDKLSVYFMEHFKPMIQV